MMAAMDIRRATEADVAAIRRVLAANEGDTSLFQQPEHQVRKTLGDFFVAVADGGGVVGCASLHWHAKDNAEILAVAVAPSMQGRRVGEALMNACVAETAKTNNEATLWLATAKPSYFARFGFSPISRFRLPVGVLCTKLFLIFQQPPGRWVPALAGRHTFMVRGVAE
jgi:amino-acid N-acetyltransferase